TLAIRQFENLMVDFLRLYQPILDRLRIYREAMQKEITGLRSSLATINGMLEVSKGIEGLAPRVQQLEANGQELDSTINDKMKITALHYPAHFPYDVRQSPWRLGVLPIH